MRITLNCFEEGLPDYHESFIIIDTLLSENVGIDRPIIDCKLTKSTGLSRVISKIIRYQANRQNVYVDFIDREDEYDMRIHARFSIQEEE